MIGNDVSALIGASYSWAASSASIEIVDVGTTDGGQPSQDAQGSSTTCLQNSDKGHIDNWSAGQTCISCMLEQNEIMNTALPMAFNEATWVADFPPHGHVLL